MSRITIKLLTVLFALGCGSGAMASPDRGQWTGYGPGYNTPTQPSPPQPPGEDQGLPPSSAPSDAQGGYHAQDPWQDQNHNQNLDDNDDDDTADIQRDVPRQGRLGVMVMGLTPELRGFFGAPSDRGVLVAKVEPNSAASRAGIQVGDVLIRVGQRSVRSGNDVLQALAARGDGRIRLGVIRRGQQVRLQAFVQARPQQRLERPMPEQHPL